MVSGTLQPLREDLRLHESGLDREGAPLWAIQDPVRNRFFRIGWLEYECLLRWPGTAARIAEDISNTTPLEVAEEQVADFGRFLEQHQLVKPSPEALARFCNEARQPGWRHWRWWLHHYLFVRIPLLRPDRLLATLLPWVQPLFGMRALVLLLLATLTGLILVARQWDTFTHQVLDLLTPAGITGFVLALVLSKSLHEMGHALVATQQGVRVAHMGVAFMVLWPMLYTDTGESWRLKSHRQRLAISIAGVATELALAGLATLAWSLLDDGTLRQAMLYLATTGWVLSLALNISPFMRFDGYFVLSDLLDFPNLHERAGATARTWLRRSLLGLPDAWPEDFPHRVRRRLVVFALLTWLYRLLIFVGIAVAVYLFFFKLLGIFLLCVELLWFVVMPVWKELRLWARRWPEVRTRRRLLFGAMALCALFPLAWPWAFDVRAPAAARPLQQQKVYAPLPGQVMYLQEGQQEVAAGALLLQLRVPDLLAREEHSQAAITALERHLGGLAFDVQGTDDAPAARERLAEQLATMQAVRAEADQLLVAAEFAGTWLDVDPELGEGSWVGVRNLVGIVVDPREWVLDAYVEEHDIDRIEIGAHATFLPEGHLGTLAARVVELSPTRSQQLDHGMLDARYGGKVVTIQGSGTDDAVPAQALYRVRLALEGGPPQFRETRGTVAIAGQRKSLLWEGTRAALAVLIRESGF